MSDDTVLDFTVAEPKRKKIRINGTSYELADRRDLRLSQYIWLAREGKRAQEVAKRLQGDGDATEISEEEIAGIDRVFDLLDEATMKIVRGLPREIAEQLDLNQKLQILDVFSQAAVEEAEGPRRVEETKKSGNE